MADKTYLRGTRKMNYTEYWEKRFSEEGKIWGESPSESAHHALKFFIAHHIRTVLVPGSGYGRNTKLFSSSGFNVVGIEISKTAYKLARQFDPLSKFYNGTVLNMSFDTSKYDAIYCFNVLHLFRQDERELFLQECFSKLKERGLAFFTVFSNEESSFGQGKETEQNTYESRPNRPVHYFTEDDLRKHFLSFEIIETGTIQDPEDHGGQPHTHILRYIFARKI
jgi:SAM-dependent methyltransferase